MAIQKINLGSEPLGEGGDTYRSANTKINENFSNKDHAASRLVGLSNGNLAEVGVAGLLSLSSPRVGWGDRPIRNGYVSIAPPTSEELASMRDKDSRPQPVIPNGSHCGIDIMFGNSIGVRLITSTNGVDLKYTAFDSDGQREPWQRFYTTSNVIQDDNGFLKAASPVIDLYDNKIDLNSDAVTQGVEFIKNGTGDYTLKTKTGLRSDNTWQIELPQDNNKNPLFAVDIDAQDDGTINIKCYKRIFIMETFLFGPDFNEPMDITEGRFISVRLNDNPEEELDEYEPEEEPTVDEVVEPEEEEPSEEFK